MTNPQLQLESLQLRYLNGSELNLLQTGYSALLHGIQMQFLPQDEIG